MLTVMNDLILYGTLHSFNPSRRRQIVEYCTMKADKFLVLYFFFIFFLALQRFRKERGFLASNEKIIRMVNLYVCGRKRYCKPL